MLLESVLEQVAGAREHALAGRLPEHGRLLYDALGLLAELRTSLDLQAGDLYAANLDDLCDYISRRLRASRRHNPVATLDEVSHLLREIRSAWLMYV